MALPTLPEDFYSLKPPYRPIGTESECVVQALEGLKLAEYIAAKAIAAAGHLAIGEFMDFGGRLYRDVEHLEICSPESPGPRAAAIWDRAAVMVLADIVDASELPHDGLHRYGGVRVFNKTTTSGHHENYMIPRSIIYEQLFKRILIGNATSRVWTWNGMVGEYGFELSQKVHDIGGDPLSFALGYRRTGHRQKPMITIPNEKHDKLRVGDSERWARAEVRFADPGFNLTTSYLGKAAMSLSLRLAEHPELVDSERLIGLSFANPVMAAQRFSSDLTFNKTAMTLNGSKITAANYQEELALASQGLAQEVELPEDEVAAIEHWITICHRLAVADLTKNEYAGLLGYTNFAVRHRDLCQLFSPELLHSRNYEAVEASLDWDRVLPAGRGMDFWDRFPSPFISTAEVDNAKQHAPKGRPEIREFLIRNQKLLAIYIMDWVSATSGYGNVSYRNPYAREIRHRNGIEKR